MRRGCSPAFLVGEWQLRASQIGYYTVILSLALSAGAYYVPQWVKTKYPLMALYLLSFLLLFVHHPWVLILHFIVLGISYSAVNTLQLVDISNAVEPQQQGQMMGLAWGIRMLGDSLLCLTGAFLLLKGHHWPIGFAICLGLVAFILSVQGLGHRRLGPSEQKAPLLRADENG